MVPARHDLLWVTPDAWAALLSSRLDLAAEPIIAAWVADGRPLVARVTPSAEAPDRIAAGLPLPGRRRIALSLPAAAVVRRASPPPLAEAIDQAPGAWRAVCTTLVAHGAPRVFGALLWQHLTGLPYLHPGSDLDLLWLDPADPDALARALLPLAASAPMAIDGEIVLRGAGVQWREFASGVKTVLAKSLDGVRLLPRRTLLRG